MTTPPISQRPFVIGVTGNIATGKSTVLRLLGALGADMIDADILYHQLIEPGQPLWHAIHVRFGDGIVTPDGRIDRQALGAIVFADGSALADLERITHPAVIAAARNRIAQSSAAVVAIDAVKLIESGMDGLCDRVWLVVCDPETQRRRLMERNGLNADEAARRLAAHPPLAGKRTRADTVVDNSADLDSTARQVCEAWATLPILSK